MIKAIYRDGQFIPEEPVELPEGQPVRVEPVDKPFPHMQEADWPTTMEGIEALLARWDSHEALEMTPEEEAELQVWRSKVKAHTIEHMNEGLEDLFE